KFIILYERRKFAAILITGILLKIPFHFLYPILPFQIPQFTGIGIILPGLIPNTIQKQRLTITFPTTLLFSGPTFPIIF
ncbi:poly-gamma-glutamate biosynthesis protein PgsC/CapC, partial [Bacillus subtilis]|uniref:poly-gamma-glutamate biosynthesis protein PgsC/CapC n=1 Tax=Bacillus subtilis TaxID=1423 RepID=UPI001BDBA531